jgi:hypothetical protein
MAEHEYKMVDVGHVWDIDKEVAAEKPEGAKKSYPSLYLTDVDLPTLPDGEFYIKAKVRKTSASVDYDDDGKPEGKSCTLEFLEIGVPGTEKSEGGKEKDLGDDLYDEMTKLEREKASATPAVEVTIEAT